jgi:outer membrane lipoprotein SlyB
LTAGNAGVALLRRRTPAPVLAGLLLVAGCAGGDGAVSPFAMGEAIPVSYGTVETVTPVKVSPAGEIAGGVAGGLLGLALTAGRSGGGMLLGAAGGALAGGLLGNALQGSDTADRFLIRRTDGSTFELTTERRDLRPGDCVAIEQGRHVNLRRANPVLCGPGAVVAADERVALEAQHDARVCQEAKQALLNARGSPAIDAGAARVKALCQG